MNCQYYCGLTGSDGNGVSVRIPQTVNVNNVARAWMLVLMPLLMKEVPFEFGSFTDPGSDTWTATVDYGDVQEYSPTLSSKTSRSTMSMLIRKLYSNSNSQRWRPWRRLWYRNSDGDQCGSTVGPITAPIDPLSVGTTAQQALILPILEQWIPTLHYGTGDGTTSQGTVTGTS